MQIGPARALVFSALSATKYRKVEALFWCAAKRDGPVDMQGLSYNLCYSLQFPYLLTITYHMQGCPRNERVIVVFYTTLKWTGPVSMISVGSCRVAAVRVLSK